MPPTDWLHGAHAPAALARGRRLLWLAVVGWVLVAQFLVGPHGIGASWRECDTQAIARNFLRDDFDLLRPRVDWRGDTDGAVECEFPLYQAAVAGLLAVFGEVEWPGRLLSLLAVVAATVALHRLLEIRAGPGGALCGAIAFLCGSQALMLGSRVIPDGLSTALALAGLPPFLRYLATGSGRMLLFAVAATALGSLQKPTALQLGLVQFLWTWALAPQRLRDPRLWAGFGAILATVGAWLAHAAHLATETGLSFGVVSGDTKFPHLWHLFRPLVELELVTTTLSYGLSVTGLIALLVLVRTRRLDRVDLALLGTAAIALLASLRYSHSVARGAHYHVFAAVAGAWCVARAWPAAPPRWLRAAFAAAMLAQAAVSVFAERFECRQHQESPLLPLAAAVAARSGPDERIVVCSHRPETDAFWQRRNNYEDPRIFYLANRRGWVVPIDHLSVERLTSLRTSGAALVVVPAAVDAEMTAAVRAWLAQTASVVSAQPEGSVLRIAGR